MRVLLESETQNVRAVEAVALLRCQVKKWIGAFEAALGGLDALVFAKRIDEHEPPVRARTCDGLGFLGIELNESRNVETAGVIPTDASRVMVRAIRTDEEWVIARSVYRALGLGMASETRKSDHATKYIFRLHSFSGRGPPVVHGRIVTHSDVAPAGAIGVLVPMQIAVTPMSQTRCQPDANSEHKRKTEGKE